MRSITASIVEADHALAPYAQFPQSWVNNGWLAVMTEGQLKTAVALLHHVNADGKCWPGTPRLMAVSGLSHGAVCAALKWLEAVKLIGRYRRDCDLRDRRTGYVIQQATSPAATVRDRGRSIVQQDGRSNVQHRGRTTVHEDPVPTVHHRGHITTSVVELRNGTNPAAARAQELCQQQAEADDVAAAIRSMTDADLDVVLAKLVEARPEVTAVVQRLPKRGQFVVGMIADFISKGGGR